MKLMHSKKGFIKGKRLPYEAFCMFSILCILSFFVQPAVGQERTKITPILKDLEDSYLKGGIEAARTFAEKNGIEVKIGNKITTVLVLELTPLEEGYGINYSSLFDKSQLYSYGIDDIKSSGNRLLADIPIDMISRIAKEVAGLQYINSPDKQITEKIKDNEKFERESRGNNGCFEVSRYIVEQKGFTAFGPCYEVEYSINNDRVYFVEIDIPTFTGDRITTYYRGIVEKGNITDFQSFDYWKQIISPSSNPLCDWRQPYRLSLAKIDNQYKWRVDFDEIKGFKWKTGTYEYENKYCLLKGYALVGKQDYDLSNLKEKYTKLNCVDAETAEAMCIRKQVESGGLCENLQHKKNACLYYKASAERSLDVCDQILNNSRLLDSCYSSVALSVFCNKNPWSDWYSKECERGTKESQKDIKFNMKETTILQNAGSGGFNFGLIGCNMTGTSISCELIISNDSGGGGIAINNKFHDPSCTIYVDENLNMISAQKIRLRDKEGDAPGTVVTSENPAMLRIYFENVSPKASKVKYLNIGWRAFKGDYTVQFKDIPLKNHPVK